MTTAYFGELSKERKIKWDNGEANPYEVLQDVIELNRKSSNLLSYGSKYFREQIQIDWGSFAWKCSSEEIMKFLNDFKDTLPWLVEDEEKMLENVRLYIEKRGNVEYGIIFIEVY